jgi:hypothetical protein
MAIGLSEYLEMKYPKSILFSKIIVSEDNSVIKKWDDSFGQQPTPEQITADMPSMEVLKTKREKSKELAATDTGMIRVVEDIWQVLKGKNLVTDADLPTASAAKLAARKTLRDAIK